MNVSMIHCHISSSVKINQNWKNNPYGLCTILASVCYLEDFVPDNEDLYKLLAQIITFRPLLYLWKEMKNRNYHRLWKYIRAAAVLVRKLLYKSAKLSRISFLKGCRPCLKGKELIVSGDTRVKLFNQTWWAYRNHYRAMHRLRQTITTFSF